MIIVVAMLSIHHAKLHEIHTTPCDGYGIDIGQRTFTLFIFLLRLFSPKLVGKI